MAEPESDKASNTLEERTIRLAPILSIVECLICLETVNIPFKMCKTGHLMCTGCMSRLSTCPLCNEGIFQENLTCIKKLVESIPHSCRHLANGCNIVVEPNDKHEIYCPLRSVCCTFSNCTDKVSVNQLVEHYKKKHGSSTLFKMSKSALHWKKFKFSENYLYNIPIATLNNFFWLQERCKSGIFEMSFYMYPIGELKEDYFIRLTLEKDNQGLTYILKASTLNGDKDNTSCLMRIHFTGIEWFVNTQGTLVISYEIYSKPKAN